MNIKYSTIRQVRITAPMSERSTVLDWIGKNGYHIKFAMPKSLGLGGACPSRLIVVAEKRIK